MGFATGVCSYCGKAAQDIPGLKFLRGVLYSDDTGTPHVFSKTISSKKEDSVVVRRKTMVVDPVSEPADETAEQASELWDSEAHKTSTPGLVDGKILGEVFSWSEYTGYGFIRSEEGFDYFTHRNSVAPDEYNRRFLIPGESVTFWTSKGHSANRFELSAVFVKPTPRVDFAVSAPVDWREEFTVVVYDSIGGTGRLCHVSNVTAKWVFFHRDNIATMGSVFPGVRVWAGLRRRLRPMTGFEAFDIAIIKEEEKGETK
jgi:cold shock CspA family protein